MRNTRATTILVLALITTAIALPVLADVAVGDKAPDFKLNNLDGKSLKLSDYTDKPTLVVFWASWCPHCQREVPVLQKVYTDLQKKGINVLGVSVDRDLEDAKAFVKDKKVTFVNANGNTDDGKKVLDVYGVKGVPTVFIVDKNGKVASRFVGEMPENQVREEFAKLGVK